MKYTRLLILLLVFASCKKQELSLYQGEPVLYFVKNWEGDLAYTFVEQGTIAITDTTLDIPLIMVGGGGSTLATPISYRIDFETDNPALIGKTGSGNTIQQQGLFYGKQDTFRLHLVRIPALADTSLLVRIKLVASEPYNTVVAGADELGFFKELDIVIDDIYLNPRGWEAFENYLGPFSSKKMRIICREFMDNQYHWNDIEDLLIDMIVEDRQQELGTLLYDFLEEQRRLGKPVLERNGEEMKAGPLMYE